MITADDLIEFLRMLPDDAGMISWELTDAGCGCYTLTTTLIFTARPGQPPPTPPYPRSLPTGG